MNRQPIAINSDIKITFRTSVPVAKGELHLYAIEFTNGFVLNFDLNLELEPMDAKNRSTDFILRTRFSLEVAIKLADAFAKTRIQNGI